MNYPITVGTSPTLVKSFLPCRIIYIYNGGDETVYWGFDSNITTSNAFPLLAGNYLSLSITDADPVNEAIYAISAAGSDILRVIVQ